MKIKKRINDKMLVVEWSVWTSKLTIHYDDETIHESWEIAFWVITMGFITMIAGVVFGWNLQFL